MAADDQQVFSISRIAQMLHVHPQTLRLYERAGFVKPVRTHGATRLYSQQDIDQLRLILHLTRDLGVNLAGVEIILRMQRQIEHLQDEIASLQQLLTAPAPVQSGETVQTQALMKATPRKLVKIS
ncbi:MAG: MerR family transcriptional regulator [Candidatus Tectomicrobia bacterium]|uniref:MerR family transcriptional regulator n=1 Tax=Tectimicrobiota bacterium TaxID=2528274 RepID=A0A937VX39_UNCTE|nr:MerR family transcriptional regulator [Candidatus Tectomicrobia bacterium]